MKMRFLKVSILTAVVTFGGATTASAQFAVIDPANLVENIISALENVESVLNQVEQLTHEVQSLAYQAQNLSQMPSSVSGAVLNQYTNHFQQLVSAMQSINGIASNVSNLTARYDQTFPNSALAQGALSSASVFAQLNGWLSQSRSVYQGAYNTQGQVMQSLGADSSSVRQLLQTSGSSQGALDAIQAGNQLTGQVASQLMKMNQQMAATNQAQMNWIAQQTQLLEQAAKHSTDISAGYTAVAPSTANPVYDRFH